MFSHLKFVVCLWILALKCTELPASVVESKLFFPGSRIGSGFSLNYGFGSGLFMKNTFELHVI
jgi:hypothetical protein